MNENEEDIIMIRNNLAVLLAQRQIKISRMALDTGLSRTTLTSLAQNESKRIDNDTLNTILMYLKITPNDFFSFLKFDFIITTETNEFDISWRAAEVNNYISIDKGIFDLFIKVDDKISTRQPTYEFEVKIDDNFNNISTEYISGMISHDEWFEDEIVNGKFVFSIEPSEYAAGRFNEFINSEVKPEFQTELSKKVITSIKEAFFKELKTKYPNADENFMKTISDSSEFVSAFSFLDFPSF